MAHMHHDKCLREYTYEVVPTWIGWSAGWCGWLWWCSCWWGRLGV